jgi:uncharacterized protein (TIGR03435 family)
MADIFNHLWQSTMFAAVVALLAFAFRRNRARLRYGLWFVASAKFLVPFAALAAVGSLVEWRQAPTSVATAMRAPGIRNVSTPFAELSLDVAAAAPAAAGTDWIAPLLFGVWVCGFAAITLRRVMQWREIRAAVRASIKGFEGFERFERFEGFERSLQIRMAPSVMEPGVVGLWKPIILLPAGIETYLSERQLAAVIAHEVCHVRRRDNLTAAIHMAVEALFWFHPMVWWIGARLVAEREQACDEHVLAETAEPVAYAEGIVTVCRRYVEAPLMSVAGVGGADVKARIEAILANRIGLRLTLPKGIGLAMAAVLTLAFPIITGAIDAAAPAAAQFPGAAPGSPPVDPETRFEVVSIKPFDASTGASRISMTPGRYDVAGMPLRLVIGQALGVPADRIIGLPDWIDKERYTIAAVSAEPAARALAVMVTNMLKDRFKMVTHRETRELPVYNLVFARTDKRLGPGLKPSPPECQAAIAARLEEIKRGGTVPTVPAGPKECQSALINPGIASFSGVEMAVIAQILTQSVGRPVIDKTGLTGAYDYTLKWTPEAGIGSPTPFGLPPGVLGRSPDAPQPVDPDAPNLFTAVQEQLGLKLESARGPVEVVVIDRLEKPTLD